MGPVPFTPAAVIGPYLCEAVFAFTQPKNLKAYDLSRALITLHLVLFSPF